MSLFDGMQMKLAAAVIPLLVGVSVVPSATAQDTGAFDMGQLTGSLSQDHITQTERRRAGLSRSSGARRGPTQQQIAACSRKSQFREQLGADDSRVRRLYGLCRSIGR